jgi:hypothetical protein
MDIGQHTYPLGMSLPLFVGNIGSDNTGLVHNPGQFRTGGHSRFLAPEDKRNIEKQEKEQTPEQTVHAFNLLREKNIFHLIL